MRTMKCISFVIFVSSLLAMTSSIYVHKAHPRPGSVRFYPKNSVFRKSDLIDNGCSMFIKKCPQIYKQNTICARHYDGKFRTFNNYCEMEFENCNGWRKWSMIKQVPC